MPSMERRVGMSRYEHTTQLSKSLNRQDIGRQRSVLDRSASLKLAPFEDEQSYKAPPHEEKEDVSGPPLDSDDEEEAGRGDIPPSIFKAKVDTGSLPKRDTTDDGFAPIRESIWAACKQPQAKPTPTRWSRRKVDESQSNTSKKPRLETSSGYKTKELDIFSIAGSSSKHHKKPLQKYGSQGKTQAPRGSQSNSESSPEAVFKKPPPGFEMHSSPNKKFKLPELVEFEELEVDEGKTFKTFQLEGCSPDSSPHKMPRFKTFPDLSGLSESEYDTPIFQTSDVMELLKQNSPPIKNSTGRIPFRALENEEDAESQPHVFQMPSIVPDMASNSQAEASEAVCLEDSVVEIAPPSSEIMPQSACPMCGESVDAMFLRNYNGGKRMNIRTQTKFCRAHKKKSARNEWADKGYPTIDWTDLDKRLSEHHSYLKDLLGGQSSYYRNILKEQVRSGKDRTLLQAISSENSMTPGYYGLRGFRAMSENIMDKFSSQLRRIAVTDRLVSARGVTGYVQAVLVPELAVRLICEDMALGVEEARQVLRESVSLGDLLNEEVEDVVVWKEGEETF